MERKRLRFVPKWEGAVEKWACKYISRHVWRTLPEHDFYDLYQEAYLKFLRCAEKYQCENGAHFMRLFQTSVSRMIHGFATKRSQRAEVSEARFELIDDESGEPLNLFDTIADGASDADFAELEFRLRVEQAPPSVKRLIFSVLFPDRCVRHEDGRRETHSERMQRVENAILRVRENWGQRETTTEFLRRIAGGVDDPEIRRRVVRWFTGEDGTTPNMVPTTGI